MKELYKTYKECGFWIFLLVIIATLTIMAAVYAGTGFIFMTMFNWLAPLFWTNAPHLSLWQSIGVIIFMLLIGGFIKGIFSK